MWILAVDTSGLVQSVVLRHADGRQFMRQSHELRSQGEIVHGFVQQCLADAGITLQALGGIACVTGPGSFTGLRIGLALVQGFARALGCPVAGYSRFALLQALAPEAVIVLESQRAELFVQFPAGPAEMLLPAEITARLEGRAVMGDGVAQLQLPALAGPSEAELAARQMLADLAAGAALPPAAPLYVRAPDVTLPKAAP